MKFRFRSVSYIAVLSLAMSLGIAQVPSQAADTWQTSTFEVNNGWDVVDVGLPLPVEDVAIVTVPTLNGSIAPGKHPVVLLLHGQHLPCYDGDQEPEPAPQWCEGWPGGTPVPSYRGYQYLADDLAREGRIVISISANGINAQANANSAVEMSARGALVEYHLGVLATANRSASPGYGSRLRGHVDSQRTVLMGHSRGGEGVMHAAQTINGSRDLRIVIQGVMNFAPVNNSQQGNGSIPVANLLPACDGDVSDQIGQTYVDRARDLYGAPSRLQSSIWMPGGNHNYLNTEWTPSISEADTGSDDAAYFYDDPSIDGSCAENVRLSPAHERAIGRDYLRAFTRLIQDQNANSLGFFDGSGDVPSATKKLGITMRSSSFGGLDSLILVPTPDTKVEGDRASGFICTGGDLPSPEPVCASGTAEVVNGASQANAWLSRENFQTLVLPTRFAVQSSWNGSGTVWASLGRRTDLSKASQVSARVVISPQAPRGMTLVLRDDAGREVELPANMKVEPVTSTGPAMRLWPQRITSELTNVGSIDLNRVTHIGMRAKGTGNAWLIDASARTPGRPASVPLLPAASIRDLAHEQAPGKQTVNITVALDTPAVRGGTFAYLVAGDGSVVANQTGVRSVVPGARFASVPVEVTMPAVLAGPVSATIVIYPLSGMSVADNVATLDVIPLGVEVPIATIRNSQSYAAPGGTWHWKIQTSLPSGSDITLLAGLYDSTIPYEILIESIANNPQLIITPEGAYLAFKDVGGGTFELTYTLPGNVDVGQEVEFRLFSKGVLVTNPSDLVGWVTAKSD